MPTEAPPPESLPAWDLPIRLFHWALVLLVVCSVTTGLLGGNLMKWHMRSGYAILTMLLFRLAWGVLGSPTARFASFLRGPASVMEHVRDLLARRPSFHLGHNPLGGWMVVVMIAALLFQAAIGLFANDDISTEGPLYYLVSKELSDRLTSLHKLNVKALYVLVGLHVAAIAFYWAARRENLVVPMLTGRKSPPAQAVVGAPFVSAWRALVLFVAAAAAVALLVSAPVPTPP
jgi:cytochrome b